MVMKIFKVGAGLIQNSIHAVRKGCLILYAASFLTNTISID